MVSLEMCFFSFKTLDLFLKEIQLMEKNVRRENQLRLVVYPIIYGVSYMSGGAGFLPSTVFSS